MRRWRVAILAADLCGYRRLVAQDQEGTLARPREDRRLIAEAVSARSGRVFNVAGDAMLAEFGSTADAFRAALDLQKAIQRRLDREPKARRMLYRVGVTVGDVVDEGGDLLGDAVDVDSRLQRLAAPGGICLARAAHRAVADAVSCRRRAGR